MKRSAKVALGTVALAAAAICLAVGIHNRMQEQQDAEDYFYDHTRD